MASPVFLQILFWAGIGGCLYGTYVLFILDNWAWPFALILGPILTRVIFERAVLSFRTYDRIVNIERILSDNHTPRPK